MTPFLNNYRPLSLLASQRHTAALTYNSFTTSAQQISKRSPWTYLLRSAVFALSRRWLQRCENNRPVHLGPLRTRRLVARNVGLFVPGLCCYVVNVELNLGKLERQITEPSASELMHSVGAPGPDAASSGETTVGTPQPQYAWEAGERPILVRSIPGGARWRVAQGYSLEPRRNPRLFGYIADQPLACWSSGALLESTVLRNC